jgi:hypothetical protein
MAQACDAFPSHHSGVTVLSGRIVFGISGLAVSGWLVAVVFW